MASFLKGAMEELLAKWIRETLSELEKAKKNQNLYRMNEMHSLLNILRDAQIKIAKLRG